MTKRIAALGIAALAFTAAASQASKTPMAPLYTTDMNGSDLQFLNAAGGDGLMQSRLGDLASKRAWTGPIKTFGEALLSDHDIENENLKRLAAEKRLTLPASLTPAQKKADRALAKLSGEQFNKACMDKIIEVQQQQIADYEAGAKSADGDIQKFAEKSLPGLKEHLLLAKKIAGIANAGKLFKAGLPVFGVSPVAPAPVVGAEGSLELADSNLIAGWAYDPGTPDQSLSVEIYDGTTLLTTVVAKEFRGDLKDTGKGDGKHFFMVPTPATLKDGKPHWIRVSVATTHFELPGSPKSVVCSGTAP